ncbi:MAG TPA: WhiB family transcriptional regulator [Mycobacterium sp.]|nr:WhiB family transcriptional regulator [Mycobacterium sp.]
MTAEPWVEAVAAILRGTPRLPGALCRQRAGLFDGDDNQDARDAAELCGHCPAREPCSAWADTLRHNQINGVIAGQRREWVSHPSAIRKHS